MVKGKIVVAAAGVTIADCAVEQTGTPPSDQFFLIETSVDVDNVTIRNVHLDGKYAMWSGGIGGLSYLEGWLVERCEIVRMGNDGIKAHKNSTYRENYIHDFRAWNVAVDGTYDTNTDPHSDGIQVQRGGNLLEGNFIVQTTTENGTSAVIVHNGTTETVTNVTLRGNYLEGDSAAVHTHPGNPDVNDPGPYGYPSALVYEDNWFGRTSRAWDDTGTPSAGITRSGNKFASNGAAVPDPALIVAP